jgi:hypothetical protein
MGGGLVDIPHCSSNALARSASVTSSTAENHFAKPTIGTVLSRVRVMVHVELAVQETIALPEGLPRPSAQVDAPSYEAQKSAALINVPHSGYGNPAACTRTR